jgi:hypothetical protein
MAQVLKLTRRDGSTEIAHIGSPYLAVIFEETFHHDPDGSLDNAWLAYFDIVGRAPADSEELKGWLRDFVGTDIAEYVAPDPTVTAATNGSDSPDSLPS